MKKIVISCFISLLSFPIYLKSEIDVAKELSKIIEGHDDKWLEDDCDSSLHSLISLKIHMAYIEKYFREIIFIETLNMNNYTAGWKNEKILFFVKK